MMFPPINEGTVACPACQAAIGAWCLNTRGTRLGGDRKPRPHPERTKAFKGRRAPAIEGAEAAMTEPFILIVHPDESQLLFDELRATPPEVEGPQLPPLSGEIGTIEGIRIVATPTVAPFTLDWRPLAPEYHPHLAVATVAGARTPARLPTRPLYPRPKPRPKRRRR